MCEFINNRVLSYKKTFEGFPIQIGGVMTTLLAQYPILSTNTEVKYEPPILTYYEYILFKAHNKSIYLLIKEVFENSCSDARLFASA